MFVGLIVSNVILTVLAVPVISLECPKCGDKVNWAEIPVQS